MFKKNLKKQILSLQNIVIYKNKKISNLRAKIDVLNKELINYTEMYITTLKSMSNDTTKANMLIDTLTKSLEEEKTQNISLKRENLTWYQKNEILKGQLDSARKIITELNKKLYIKENAKNVKKYCSNKTEGI